MKIFFGKLIASLYKKYKKYTLIAVVVVGIFAIGLAAFFLFGGSFGNILRSGTYSELQELSQAHWSFQEYSTYYQKLADKKGAEYAFEVMKRAPFPPGIDLHLLAHVVGDMLFKQEGVEGIKICTQDFRNSCSHSVVIGVLNEKGEGGLDEIAKTCKEAPGGKGAYAMCFHGLGHGVLAYNGYDFEKAIAMCKKTGTTEYQNREYVECVGGATMEMIAGVHDRTAWERQQAKYFKKSDPLYPCDAPFMTSEVRPICYIYLTPHLFESAGMDLGFPDPKFYGTAFSFCSKISKDAPERDACYGGLGKEFIVIAQGRDVRDIGSMQEPALKDVRSWCALADDTTGEAACNSYALSSLFWGGENNPNASFLFCAVAEGTSKEQCYRELSGHVSYYFAGDPRGQELCARLPETYRAACTPTAP